MKTINLKYKPFFVHFDKQKMFKKIHEEDQKFVQHVFSIGVHLVLKWSLFIAQENYTIKVFSEISSTVYSKHCLTKKKTIEIKALAVENA